MSILIFYTIGVIIDIALCCFLLYQKYKEFGYILLSELLLSIVICILSIGSTFFLLWCIPGDYCKDIKLFEKKNKDKEL